MSDPQRDGPPASPRLRDDGDGTVAPRPDGRRPLANAVAAVRRWLARTFGALTWKVFGVFGLVVVVIGLCQPAAFYALFFDIPLPGMPVRKPVPGMPTGIIGLAKAIATQFLLFTPVLIAVVAVESRRFRTERARRAGAGRRHAARPGRRNAPVVLGAPDLLCKRVLPNNGEPFGDHWPLAISSADSASEASPTAGLRSPFTTSCAGTPKPRRPCTARRSATRRPSARAPEARLQVMQAQIEPHFLFNTLASVRRLYQVDRGSGRAMLQHLVRYLTASLPRLRESRSTLERELALALAYLNVQKIRMESRLTFEVDVPRPLEAHVVPPMMLATLVENAVIHGVSPLPDGGRIRISARADAENSCSKSPTRCWPAGHLGGGVGLSNIRARLALGVRRARAAAEARRRGRTAASPRRSCCRSRRRRGEDGMRRPSMAHRRFRAKRRSAVHVRVGVVAGADGAPLRLRGGRRAALGVVQGRHAVLLARRVELVARVPLALSTTTCARGDLLMLCLAVATRVRDPAGARWLPFVAAAAIPIARRPRA